VGASSLHLTSTRPVDECEDGAVSTPEAATEELRAFYSRYIDAFNERDNDAFSACFHLPVTVFPLNADDRPAGRPPTVVTEVEQLWPAMPSHWTRSTIDDLRVVADEAAFTARDGFAEARARRPALQVTVTRWASDEPYEQVHVIYLLTREQGRLGIKAMVPLALARPAPGSS
jgi:hypothetical protein